MGAPVWGRAVCWLSQPCCSDGLAPSTYLRDEVCQGKVVRGLREAGAAREASGEALIRLAKRLL